MLLITCRAVHVEATWGRNCDKLVFLSDQISNSPKTQYQVMELAANKTREIVSEVWRLPFHFSNTSWPLSSFDHFHFHHLATFTFIIWPLSSNFHTGSWHPDSWHQGNCKRGMEASRCRGKRETLGEGKYEYMLVIFIGPRCPWSDLCVRMSGCLSVSPPPLWNLTELTLADEDTNSILTDNDNRAIQGNVTQPSGWISNICKCRHLMANLGTNASGAPWWPIFNWCRWHRLVAKIAKDASSPTWWLNL